MKQHLSRWFAGVLVAFSAISFVSGAVWAGANSLDLNPRTVAPGAPIMVRYTTEDGLAANAWVGIIPSNIPHGSEAVNDQHDIQYKYLQGATAGSLQFTAPAAAGSYDLRMHDTDSDGKELTHITFQVK